MLFVFNLISWQLNEVLCVEKRLENLDDSSQVVEKTLIVFL